MEKICWDNSDYENSEVVIIGIPDESQSHSLRAGTSKAPDQIRETSNMADSYTRNNKKSLGFPSDRITKNIHDFGNITRDEMSQTFEKVLSDSKIPISIGGDHSMSTEIIKKMSEKSGKVSLVYFDAHPDFITSTKNYYGSVFGDVLEYIDPQTSIQIGIRTPEQEEMDNLEKNQIKVITPFDVAEKRITDMAQEITKIIGSSVYVSFDMDCVDPAHAPGVSVPVPAGLSSIDAMYLLKKIAYQGILGMDIVEVCPPYDINNRTSHLASRIIGEVISSIRQYWNLNSSNGNHSYV